MSKKIYAVVGNFGFHARPRGLTVYRYDAPTAGMELVETILDDVNVGHITVDAERHLVYITNECSNLREQVGGGGYLLALKLDPRSGKLNLVSEKPTLSGKPCYTCLDKTRRYMLVSHHADSGYVTKIVKGENGFSSVTVFDDAALVLFRVNLDGSLGEICDVALMRGEGAASPHAISHLHSVLADSTGELFLVQDKGLDQIQSFSLDRENGKLLHLADTPVETGSSPRYGAFHPTLPLYYVNFEQKSVVQAFRYSTSSGRLELIYATPLLNEEAATQSGAKAQPADILIHPGGKTLYVSIRGVNMIAVLDINAEGTINLRENILCGGENPRSLSISPDRRFLFATNVSSGEIAVFSIAVDGSLTAAGKMFGGRCPGSLRWIEID